MTIYVNQLDYRFKALVLLWRIISALKPNHVRLDFSGVSVERAKLFMRFFIGRLECMHSCTRSTVEFAADGSCRPTNGYLALAALSTAAAVPNLRNLVIRGLMLNDEQWVSMCKALKALSSLVCLSIH